MTVTASETRVFCIPCLVDDKHIVLFERVQNVVFIRVHKREWSLIAGLGGVVRTECPRCEHSVTIRLDTGAGIV